MHEFRTSNLNIAYPFVDNAKGLQVFGSNILVDAAITAQTLPAYLVSCTRHDDITIEFVVRTGDYYCSATAVIDNNDFVIAEGITHSEEGNVPVCVVRLLVNPEGARSIDTGITLQFDTELKFAVSATKQQIPGVNTLSSRNFGYNTIIEDDATYINGDVKLLPGYNVMLTQNAEGIIIESGAGYGLGRLPCIPEEDIEQPGFTGPNINIQTDDCYSVIPTGDILQIQGRCTVCCTCDDYVAVLERGKAIAERIKSIKAKLDNTHSKYEDSIEYYQGADGYLDNRNLDCFDVRITGTMGLKTKHRARLLIMINNTCTRKITINRWEITDISPTVNNDYTTVDYSLSTLDYTVRIIDGTVPEYSPVQPHLADTIPIKQSAHLQVTLGSDDTGTTMWTGKFKLWYTVGTDNTEYSLERDFELN